MAIYHFHCKIISRGQGRSAVGASAYRSGTQMTNDFDGIEHDYTKKQGVVHSEVMLPEQAPKEFENRSVLWNEVEQQEKGSKAQLAREVEVALPRELSRAEQVRLVRDYVQENFVKKGMCADIAIHDKGDGNPHAHIMLTTRPIEKDGTWGAKATNEYVLDKDGNRILQKVDKNNRKIYKRVKRDTTDWNTKEFLQRSREQWGVAINRELERKNLPDRVDHRSFEEQGKEKIPSRHIGVSAAAMERRGIETDRGKENRAIQEKNRQLHGIDREIVCIKRDIGWTKLHEKHETLSQLVDERRITAEQPRKAHVDIDQKARELSELRQTFVDEYARSLERTDYRINPIYQQQAYQIESLAKSVAEKGKTIKQLQEQRGKFGLFKGKQKKVLDEKIYTFSKYQREDMEKLKALGVDDLSRVPQAIAYLRMAADQEQAEAEAAKQNQGAVERAQSAQAAFLSKVESIPQSQRQAVFERMERISTKKPRGSVQMSMNRAKAEIQARRVLDNALQQKSRVRNQKQRRGHDFDRSR